MSNTTIITLIVIAYLVFMFAAPAAIVVPVSLFVLAAMWAVIVPAFLYAVYFIIFE